MSAPGTERTFIFISLPLYRPTATLRYESVNAFITMFIKVMGSTAAHYFAERKNSNR